mgnify:CR=1 FL=1
MPHPQATHELDDATWSRPFSIALAHELLQQSLQILHPDPDGSTATTSVVLSAMKEGVAQAGVQQFSISLLGPAEPLLPQRSYRVRSAAHGDFAIFITPIARHADGVEYEACFSHAC